MDTGERVSHRLDDRWRLVFSVSQSPPSITHTWGNANEDKHEVTLSLEPIPSYREFYELGNVYNRKASLKWSTYLENSKQSPVRGEVSPRAL